MDTEFLRFFETNAGFLVLPLRGRRHSMLARRCYRCRHHFTGDRGRGFTGGWGRRRGTPEPPLNNGNRPGPSMPAAAAASSTTSGSFECTRTATPLAVTHLLAPTPPEDTPHRPLAFCLRQPGCTVFGIGVIPTPNPRRRRRPMMSVSALRPDLPLHHRASPTTMPQPQPSPPPRPPTSHPASPEPPWRSTQASSLGPGQFVGARLPTTTPTSPLHHRPHQRQPGQPARCLHLRPRLPRRLVCLAAWRPRTAGPASAEGCGTQPRWSLLRQLKAGGGLRPAMSWREGCGPKNTGRRNRMEGTTLQAGLGERATLGEWVARARAHGAAAGLADGRHIAQRGTKRRRLKGWWAVWAKP